MPNWVGCCRTLTPCVEVALLVCGVSYPLSLHQSREGSWFCQVQDLTTFFTPAECFFSGVFTSDYGFLGPFMITFLPDPVAFSINCAQLFQCINLQGAFLAPLGALIVSPFRDPSSSSIHPPHLGLIVPICSLNSVQYGLDRPYQTRSKWKSTKLDKSGWRWLKVDEGG